MIKRWDYRLKILGETWKYSFLSLELYNKLHPDNPESAALTLSDSREMHFCLSDFTDSTARHEMLHAYYNELPVMSANLELDQLEEIMCDIVGRYGPKLIRQANTICKNYLKAKREFNELLREAKNDSKRS